MKIFLLLIIIIIQFGCATVEVAKEVTKASESIKKTVQNIIDNNEEEVEKNNTDEKVNEKTINEILIEKENIEVEKKEQKKVIKKQKEVIEVNFVGKTINEIYMRLGDSDLFRLDGNTQTMRYDSNSCRLFLFFNSTVPIPRVEYFEMRDQTGKLINDKISIQNCYKNFDLNL